MESARHLRLAEVRKADLHGRSAIFHPVNAAGEPIYVHAKVLVVHDRLIRVGSSNIDNRSMGADTECDLAFEARTAGQAEPIRAMRGDLLAEHLDCEAETLRRQIELWGSVLAAVDVLRRDRGRSLQPLPEYVSGDLGVALSRSRLADPERPRYPATMFGHAVKRVALRAPLSAFAALGTAAAIIGAAEAMRRRRRRRDGDGVKRRPR